MPRRFELRASSLLRASSFGLPILLALTLLAKPSAPRPDVSALADSFEVYPDPAAFEKVWQKHGNPTHHFDPTFGRDSKKSVKLADPPRGGGGAAGATNRFYRNLPVPLTPSDDAPVIFSFDLHLDPAGAPNNWSAAWESVDIRGYAGGAMDKGDVTGVISIGLAQVSSDPHSHEFFQARILTPDAFAKQAPITAQYYTLDAKPKAPKRSPGWHTLTARIGATSTTFLIDNIPAETVPVGLTTPLTTIVIGSGLSPGNNPMSIDNLSVHQSPAIK